MKVLALSCFILIACCSAAVLAEDRRNAFSELSVGCRKEFGVTEEEYVNLKAGRLNEADVKDNMKCSVLCFLLKAGFMNDAGQFNADAMKTAFSERPGLDEALEKCQKLDNPNACAKAFTIAHCIFQRKAEM